MYSSDDDDSSGEDDDNDDDGLDGTAPARRQQPITFCLLLALQLAGVSDL